MFDDNAQQCFAFTTQANFHTHNLNFTEGEGDEIKSRIPFQIFSTLKDRKKLAVKQRNSKNEDI